MTRLFCCFRVENGVPDPLPNVRAEGTDEATLARKNFRSYRSAYHDLVKKLAPLVLEEESDEELSLGMMLDMDMEMDGASGSGSGSESHGAMHSNAVLDHARPRFDAAIPSAPYVATRVASHGGDAVVMSRAMNDQLIALRVRRRMRLFRADQPQQKHIKNQFMALASPALKAALEAASAFVHEDEAAGAIGQQQAERAGRLQRTVEHRLKRHALRLKRQQEEERHPAPAASPSLAELEASLGADANADAGVTAAAVASDAAADEAATLASGAPLEYLGHALAKGDFNQDNITDLVMGAYGHTPALGQGQQGRVFVLFGGGKANGTGPQGAVELSLSGQDAVFARFGYALAALDFNLDGVDDLVVAAPNQGWPDWTPGSVEGSPLYQYFGAVHVFFGTAGSAGFASTPDVTIKAANRLTFLGMSLATGDLDGDGHADLLIGNEFQNTQAGVVLGFLSSASRKRTGSALSDAQADVTLSGQDSFALFGRSMLVAHDPVQGPLLVVGAPAYRLTYNGPTVGKILAFKVGSAAALAALKSDPAPVFSIHGVQELGKFGFSLAFGAPVSAQNPMLAVSSPTDGTGALTPLAGQVRIFSVSQLAGNMTIDQVVLRATIQGTAYGGRFGWNLEFADLNGDMNDELIASDPLENQITWGEQGKKAVKVAGALFPFFCCLCRMYVLNVIYVCMYACMHMYAMYVYVCTCIAIYVRFSRL